MLLILNVGLIGNRLDVGAFAPDKVLENLLE